jgi:putative ATPase
VLRGSGYRGAQARGHGQGYVSPHDDPAAADVAHLPAGLEGRTYYVPSGNGDEADEEAARGDRHR